MATEILLCDLDAFFASVEQRDHPEYWGRPVVVGGRAGSRGVVATCSYEARRYGIRSAMPMVQAERLCPGAVFLPVNMDHYRRVSAQVFAIYGRFAAQIEKVSIDEGYLAMQAGAGAETAQGIRWAVKKELGLSVSVGMSCNKLLAKMACDLAKPDGFLELALGDVPKIIWPLPVGKLYGIGPHTREKLYRIGIMTIGQLAQFPRADLIKIVGAAAGVALHQRAHGVDHREIQVERRVKSIGEETTFPRDVYDRDTILITLLELAGQVGHRLRREGLVARTVTVKIRFSDFRTITRSQSVHGAVAGGEAICQVAQELFLAHCGKPPWRLVGVQVANLDSWQQLTLFEGKDERLSRVVDQLRDKYGLDIVKRASLIPGAEKTKGEPGEF